MPAARGLVIAVPRPQWGGGAFAELPSVEFDGAAMMAMLKSRQFDVSLPTGPAPDVTPVKSALLELVDATHEGDLAVIYFSGHGSRKAGREPDGWDEIVVCNNGYIEDNWFRDELWPKSREGSNIVVIVDACHSATSFLDLLPPEDELVPPPKLNAFSDPLRYRLVLSACADEEVARVLPAGEGSLVTSTMLAMLQENPEISYLKLWEDVTRIAPGRDVLAGKPQYDYFAPDPLLLNSKAFSPEIRAPAMRREEAGAPDAITTDHLTIEPARGS